MHEFNFRCCLVHISIIILRHVLYLLNMCPCLDRGLSMLYLCDLFFIFIMFIRIISWIQTHLFFLAQKRLRKTSNRRLTKIISKVSLKISSRRIFLNFKKNFFFYFYLLTSWFKCCHNVTFPTPFLQKKVTFLQRACLQRRFCNQVSTFQ